MAAPYLRMTVAVFVILSVATERILPFCHSEAKAEESHERKVGTSCMGFFTYVQNDNKKQKIRKQICKKEVDK